MKQPITSKELYHYLLKKNGASGKWPHSSPWEIMLGAFLVQNTTWYNTELSLKKIELETQFDPHLISQYQAEELIPLIYSSGFHKNKSQLIYHWFQWLKEFHFDKESILTAYPTTDLLRQRLLDFKGIGNETADVLLLYVFDTPAFIADNYARKLYTGLSCLSATSYMPLKQFVESSTELSVFEWQDFHGQILNFGKEHLKGKGPHFAELFEKFQIVGGND